MTHSEHLDFGQLIGFDQLMNSSAEPVDFLSDAFGARLGAKRGAIVEPGATPDEAQAAD